MTDAEPQFPMLCTICGGIYLGVDRGGKRVCPGCSAPAKALYDVESAFRATGISAQQASDIMRRAGES